MSLFVQTNDNVDYNGNKQLLKEPGLWRFVCTSCSVKCTDVHFSL